VPSRNFALENFLAPFRASVGRQHRIERHGAVVMEAHPIVGKYRIRLCRFLAIGGDQHFHAGAYQGISQGIEFL
jgi:hypothetical protein